MFVYIGHVWKKKCFGWPHGNIDEITTRKKNHLLCINSVWSRDNQRSDQWGISWQLPKEFWQYFYVLYSRRPMDEHFLSWFWRGIYSRLQVSDITVITESISYIYSIRSLYTFWWNSIWIYALGRNHFESGVQCNDSLMSRFVLYL